MYSESILINELVLDELSVDDLLQLEKITKLRIRNSQGEFRLFDIVVNDLDDNDYQENILKFNKEKKLVAAKVTIQKFENWVNRNTFEKIMNGLYRQVEKHENIVTYQINDNYIKLLDIPRKNALQIIYG